MKKSLILFLVIAMSGCNQLDRFHDKEIALEVEYVSVLLDKVHRGDMDEDLSVYQHYFVDDSTLIWSCDPDGKPGKGWYGMKERTELRWDRWDSLEIKVQERVINMDDMGTIAWFFESVDLRYEMDDSLITTNDVLVSGVLQKLGQSWKIVQYHTSFPCRTLSESPGK